MLEYLSCANFWEFIWANYCIFHKLVFANELSYSATFNNVRVLVVNGVFLHTLPNKEIDLLKYEYLDDFHFQNLTSSRTSYLVL